MPSSPRFQTPTVPTGSTAVKAEQQKGMVEQAKDTVKGMTDLAASTVQPESKNSAMGDTTSGNSNMNSGSLLNSAKDGEQLPL
ncbi:hypothetical protein JB92DRAFT_3134950 [Gautieria morchelliformis]|nr:hypothetical protein JB92DRAFT_3134950 [Gautieria morchelliformis]